MTQQNRKHINRVNEQHIDPIEERVKRERHMPLKVFIRLSELSEACLAQADAADIREMFSYLSRSDVTQLKRKNNALGIITILVWAALIPALVYTSAVTVLPFIGLFILGEVLLHKLNATSMDLIRVDFAKKLLAIDTAQVYTNPKLRRLKLVVERLRKLIDWDIFNSSEGFQTWTSNGHTSNDFISALFLSAAAIFVGLIVLAVTLQVSFWVMLALTLPAIPTVLVAALIGPVFVLTPIVTFARLQLTKLIAHIDGALNADKPFDAADLHRKNIAFLMENPKLALAELTVKLSHLNDGTYLLAKKGFINRLFSKLFNRTDTRVSETIQHTQTEIANLDFSLHENVDGSGFSHGLTALLDTISHFHKIRQTLVNANAPQQARLLQECDLLDASAFTNPNIAQQPLTVSFEESSTFKKGAPGNSLENNGDGLRDSHVVTKKFLFWEFKFYYYSEPEQSVDHNKEAGRIFSSTQLERIKGSLGNVLKNFGLNLFDNANYFRKGEMPQDIYAKDDCVPYSLTENLQETVPSSHWLGHASCLLTVPVKLGENKTGWVNVLTDPVEGDLNPILYPRRTKFSTKIEHCP